MMALSSLAATTCLPSGVNHAASGALKVCPAARSPARGNCHILRPLGSMISTRSPPPSEIRIGPGNTEGSEPGASQPGPEAVSAVAPLNVVAALVGVGAVAAAPRAECDATDFAGGLAGVAAAMSHQDPTATPAVRVTSSPLTSRQCRRSSGEGARRCLLLTVILQVEHGPG